MKTTNSLRLSLFLCLILKISYGYKIETVNTSCFFVDKACHESHAKAVAQHIHITTDQIFMTSYVSHSTTTTKYGMHSIIVYK